MKKRKDYWFPKTRPRQRQMFLNIRDKIGNYALTLPLSAAKVERLILICNIFLVVYDYVEQTRATSKSLTDWQDLIFEAVGGQVGASAPAAPAFQPVNLPAESFVGIFQEFKELVADIKSADNYTEAIGEDLMIVGAETDELAENELVAELKRYTPTGNYSIRLEGSLQGMKLIRVEYWAAGATVPQVDKFDKLPAVMTIIPKTAGEPESGILRCYLLKDNEQIGLSSPDYRVTVHN